ncbi:zona pellucida sperm-binding protein 4-like [Ranitomeya variabilis]|uniref:zona pellucida sperm-binding protein 4-like n=1 Tax=Ranitomeya variabilis TaxID=490064 RepID=UPI004055BB69
MGLCRVWFGLVVALWASGLGSPVGAVQDFWNEPSHLQCGADAMEFSLPSLLGDAVFALAVIDKNGKSHYFHNDSACGTWLGQKSDGSMALGSTFRGCYVREENDNYVMTITLEEVFQDGKSQYRKKDLMCPILLAMDAPSPSDCASVQPADRLPCANDSVSRDLCEGLGCCFSQYDRLRCYYGKKLTAYCNAENKMVVAISKDLTVPSLILDSVNIMDVDSASCPELRVATTASFIGFQLPLSCGGANQVAESLVYERTFVATNRVLTWQRASITRDSNMRVTVRCNYGHTGVIPLQVEVLTLPPPLPVSTSGPLLLEMRIAKDQQYTSYYTEREYPIERVLRDPVHTEVRILQRTDPSLVLVLNNCWATNSPVPTDSPQWPILSNSCPFQGDNYLTELVPVVSSQSMTFPTHYKRFIVNAFTFVDANTQTALSGLVFFHCSASVCVPSATESCSINCARRKKRMVDTWGSDITVTSNGPIVFNTKLTEMEKLLHEEEGRLDSEVLMAWLQAGAAAVGILLSVYLLGIYLYKRHNKCVVSTLNP